MLRTMRRVESIIPRRARAFGGKAANLAALARAGFPVPAAYALSGRESASALDSFLDGPDRLDSLLRQPTFEPARLRQVAERVRTMELPEPIVSDLQHVYEELTQAGAQALVVRSSSTQEDQESASAAGLHASFLNIVSVDGLIEATRACWASLFEPAVLSYLRRVAHGSDPKMGLIVQAFVPAEVAGVAFTANPLTGDATEVIVNSSFGLGPAVVDGRVSPDMFRVAKETGALRDRVIGEKTIRLAAAGQGGIASNEIPPDRKGLASLDDHLLAEVVQLACRAEARFGRPQDVEWAVAGGSVFILQSRPITTFVAAPRSRRRDRRSPPPQDRSRIVWSNVNVGEALPGVATPLTWSVLSGFSELGFRRAFAALGCRVPKDAELVGNFRGTYLPKPHRVQ